MADVSLGQLVPWFNIGSGTNIPFHTTPYPSPTTRRVSLLFSNDVVGVTNKTITGIITKLGVPVNNCVVRLYFRSNGNLFYQTTTNSSGVYTFNDIPNNDSDYYVVAIDPSNSYNVGRLDRMTPG